MKRYYLLLLAGISLWLLTCCTMAQAAEQPTTVSQLMELLKEEKQQSVYNIKLNAPFAKGSSGVRENISTETGELNVTNTIFAIPGRNGQDLVLGLRYQNRDAKIYDEATASADLANNYGQNIIAFYDVFAASGYWLRTGALNYPASVTTIEGETTIGNERWVFTGYLQYESGTTIMTAGNIINTTRQKSIAAASRDIFGQGWSLDLPWVEMEGENTALTFPDGRTYVADFNTVNGLKDYELTDLMFTQDTSSGNGATSSAYRLYFVNGDAYYFSAQGELLLQSDRFQNSIRYYWEEMNGKRLLTKIVDSVGRPVTISYSENLTVFKSGNRTARLLKNPIPGQADKYYLSAYIDPAGRRFNYYYSFQEAAFDQVGKTAVDNRYVNLLEIRYPSGAKTRYQYGKGKKNLGLSGYMEYFKVSGRQDQDGDRVYNRLTYRYFNEPDGYPAFKASNIDEQYRYYTRVTDSKGLVTRYSYNAMHLPYLEEQTGDRLYNRTTTLYHSQYKLPIKTIIRTYNPQGKYSEQIDLCTYDSRGNVTSENHPDNPKKITDERKVSYSYDRAYNLLTGRKYKQSGSMTISEKYTLTPDKKKTKTMQVYGNGRLANRLDYDYDRYGNLIKQTIEQEPGKPAVTCFEYGKEYQGAYLTGVISQDVADADHNKRDIRSSATYDFKTGLKLSATDGNGNTTRYSYDPASRLLKETYPDQSSHRYIYDDQSNILQAANARGTTLMYQYDGLGNLLTVTEKGKKLPLAEMTYDNNETLISQKDGNRNIKKYGYDKVNRITDVTHLDKNGVTMAQTRAAYNEAYDDRFGKILNNITLRKKGDERDQVVNYYFDRYGHLVKLGRINQGQAQWAYNSYDHAGNKIETIDFAGQKSLVSYDCLGRAITSTNAEGEITQYRYDRLGNLTAVTDALGKTAYSEFNSLGQKVRVKVPYESGTYSENKYYYDPAGNLEKIIDPEGYQTQYYYSTRNMLTAVEKHLGNGKINLTRCRYDREGNLTAIEKGLNSWNDEDFSTNTYQYDSLNRLIREEDAGHRATSYEYDNNSNLITVTDRNSVVTGFTYDGLNRVIAKQNSKDGKRNIINTTYDLLGYTRQITDPSGTTSFEYDDLGHLIYVNYGNGITQRYAYDTADRVSGMNIKQGGLSQIDLAYRYDRVGRLTMVNDQGKQFEYSYDDIGRLTEELNGVTGSKSEYAYYPSGNIKSLRHYGGSQELIANYEYRFDKRGNQTQKDEGDKTTSYTYDALSRLKTALLPGGIMQNYEYDDLGNIKEMARIKGNKIEETKYVYDQDSRLLLGETIQGDDVAQQRYEYDQEGNQISKEEVIKQKGNLISSKTTNFWYNGYNQLTRVQNPDNQFIEYNYNGQGLRTSKNYMDDSINYYYDRGNIVLETDQEQRVTAKNIRGIQLIYRESQEQSLYYLHNAHGDVTKLLDEKGDIIKDYEYDPYGREAAEELPAYGGDRSSALWRQEVDKLDNPFHYCGEYLDGETGNYYLRARYYSPDTGRFISQDSYAGSVNDPLSLNLYTYCGNNPVVRIDPSGNFSIGSICSSIIGAAVSIGFGSLVGTVFSRTVGSSIASAIDSYTSSKSVTLEQVKKFIPDDKEAKEYLENYNRFTKHDMDYYCSFNCNWFENIDYSVDCDLSNLDGLKNFKIDMNAEIFNPNAPGLLDDLYKPKNVSGYQASASTTQSKAASANNSSQVKRSASKSDQDDYDCFNLIDVIQACHGAFMDSCRDPVTIPALKQTGLAVVTTSGAAAIHPITAGGQLLVGVAYEAYTNGYGASTTRLISPSTPITIQTLFKYFRP